MGRPRKLTLDFFLHDADASSDKKLRAVSRCHGNDGYSTFFRLLEFCCRETGVQLCLKKRLDAETVAEDCYLRDVPHLFKIIETCVEVGLFDKQLWESERIVLSHGLHKRYLSRIEERRKDAERKQQQKLADDLQTHMNEFSERKTEVFHTEKHPIRTESAQIQIENKNKNQIEKEIETAESGISLPTPRAMTKRWDWGFQGSEPFLQERPWVQKWKSVNAVYDQGFLAYLQSTVGRNDMYKGSPSIGDMKKWLNVANFESEKMQKRLSDASVEWDSYQESKQAKANRTQYKFAPHGFEHLSDSGGAA